MNIQVPYKWLKEYLQTKHTAQELATLLPLHGPQVEKVIHNDDLDDDILDIEITPNRVDTASITGIAREAGAITKEPFVLADPIVEFPESDLKDIAITIEEKERCYRFHAIVIDGVKVTESPEWLKQKIEALGHRSINNLVDISNYVLLEYGYPTHIFDYEKIEGNQIIIRRAKNGEQFETLDGETKELTSEDLVIADITKAISLAGVKGGMNSGVSTSTKTIVIEAANFEPYAIRKTARRHELHTDAASLFEKGLSPLSATPAILRVAELVQQIAGGKVVSTLKDESSIQITPKSITFNINEIERLLGVVIPINEVTDILTRLDFECSVVDERTLEVTVPHFRSIDVQYDYDLVEEIARIYGYDKIPSRVLDGAIPQVESDEMIEWENKVKDILAGAGLTEQFSVSMIGDNELEVMNLQPTDVLAIYNPLSVEYKYMRTELISTFLMTAKNNEDYADKLSLFELNMVYIPQENDLPQEIPTLAIMINGTNDQEVFSEVKGYFEHILQTFAISLDRFELKAIDAAQPFANGAYAEVIVDKANIGTIGLISTSIQEKHGIKKTVAILQVDFPKLVEILKSSVKSYKPTPRYPAVLRDFAFIVDEDVMWGAVKMAVKNTSSTIKNIDLFDIYQGKGIDTGKKSIAFSVSYQAEDRTLTDEEVEEMVEKLKGELSRTFNALLRA